MIYLEYFLLALGFVTVAIAGYHLFSALDCKRPEVPWSSIHPLAERAGPFMLFFRGMLVLRPQYLTEEGRHHMRVGTKFFIAAMIVLVIASFLGGVRRP